MRIYPFFIPHAGCPHQCVFCQQQQTSGFDAPPSVDEVFEKLQGMLPESGGGEVAFYGGSFSLLPAAVQAGYLDAAASYVQAERVDGIRISTRPDGLCAERVELLARHGVTTVEIGCQSFSDEVLRCAGRGHVAGDVEGAVKRLRSAGIHVGLQLMPGLPGSDAQEAMASLTAALRLKPDFIRIYPTVVLKGTRLEVLYQKGLYRPMGLEEATGLCAGMLWECRKASMPVIRIGLQEQPGLKVGEKVLDGPCHPAFGQLVRSRLWYWALKQALGQGASHNIRVSRYDLSDVLGHKGQNRTELFRQFPGVVFAADGNLCREGVVFGEKCTSLEELLHIKEQGESH